MANYRLRFELPTHLQAEALTRLTGDEDTVDDMIATLKEHPRTNEDGIDGLLLFLSGVVFDEKGVESLLLMLGYINEDRGWALVKQRITESEGIRIEIKGVPTQLVELTNEPVTERVKPLQ